MSISEGVIRTLEEHGPATVDEIGERMSLPVPHVRAAVSELCFKERRVTCDREGRFRPGTPPDDWPRPKR